MNGRFIDITGGEIRVRGFDTVALKADNDIRLSDIKYVTKGTGSGWAGAFSVDGNLTLTSARTYVTTGSYFTLSADNGSITTLSSGEAAGTSSIQHMGS